MSSPNKRMSSPKKRPTTANNMNNSSVVERDAFGLQEQLNASLVREQDKDIEIERLMTTCKTLNAKCVINDDLHEEIGVLRKRIAEQDNMLKIQKEEIENYERTI